MAWLVSGDRVFASADVLSGRRARAKGLLGRSGVEGAVVLEHCRWIHSIGMRFALDVAYIDASGTVIKTAQLKPYRLCVPVFGACTVVEAALGSFDRWGLQVGDVVEVRN